jgi:hypothetical protein
MRLQLFVVPTLCLLSSVVAAPTVNQPQDTTVIMRSFKNVEASLNRLLAAIKHINPRMPTTEVARRWPEIDRQCHEVSDILWHEAREIRRSPGSVNLIESATLLQPISSLQSVTSKIVDEWIAIKPAINNSDRRMVQDMLKDHQTAASEYAEALLSKQSGLSSPVGRLFGADTQNTIQRAINAYKW